ncbi:MAG TPA: hypothetical protein VGI81_07310 [Tepidisphaeraceae bacterium]|jgi:hypothetical protein
MISKQVVKWGAAAALAVGTIPALGLAKSHVSLPTNNITVTPTSAMEAPVTKTSSHVTHAKVSKASHKKHRSSKHRSSAAVHHKSKASASHVKKASSKHSHKSAAKTIRVS